MQIFITFNDNNGDIEIGPLDKLADMDESLAAEFVDLAVEALQALRLSIKPFTIEDASNELTENG